MKKDNIEFKPNAAFRTVGDLIEILKTFDPERPIALAHGTLIVALQEHDVALPKDPETPIKTVLIHDIRTWTEFGYQRMVGSNLAFPTPPVEAA